MRLCALSATEVDPLWVAVWSLSNTEPIRQSSRENAKHCHCAHCPANLRTLSHQPPENPRCPPEPMHPGSAGTDILPRASENAQRTTAPSQSRTCPLWTSRWRWPLGDYRTFAAICNESHRPFHSLPVKHPAPMISTIIAY